MANMFSIQPADVAGSFRQGVQEAKANQYQDRLRPLELRRQQLGIQQAEQGMEQSAGEYRLKQELYKSSQQDKRIAGSLADSASVLANADTGNGWDYDKISDGLTQLEADYRSRGDIDLADKFSKLNQLPGEDKARILGMSVNAGRELGLIKGAPSKELSAYERAVQQGFEGTELEYDKIKANLKEPSQGSKPEVVKIAERLYGDKAAQDQYIMAQKQKTGTSMSIDPETGAVTMQTGVPVGDMSKPTQASIEKSLVGLIKSKNNLDQIKVDFDPNALTYAGKVGTFWNKTKEKAGIELSPDEAEGLASVTRFRNGVEQTFNEYRKEITGAAASVKELDRLKRSLINTDMSPTEFKAAFDQFSNIIDRSITLYQDLLQKGVSADAAGRAVDSNLEVFQKEPADTELEAKTSQPVPEGWDPEDWNYLTPEEQAQFK